MQNAKTIKKKINKFNHVKMKNLSSKDTVKTFEKERNQR